MSDDLNIEDYCNICGDKLSNGYAYKTNCNHIFHYECLMKSLVKSLENKNMCPLCRDPIDKLPVVNGLKKLIRGIHYNEINEKNEINYVNTSCQYVLKMGKNKGQVCNNNCKIGFDYCGKHFKKFIISETL